MTGRRRRPVFRSRDRDWVVAGHLLGLGDNIGDRRGELPRLLDRERVVGVQLVHRDVAGDAPSWRCVPLM